MSQPSNAKSYSPTPSGTRFSTALMVALCTLMGVNLLVMAVGSGPGRAGAQVSVYGNAAARTQPPSGVQPAPENVPSSPVTAVEMLKRLIELQTETNARLAAIEGQMRDTYNVTVTNFPATK